MVDRRSHKLNIKSRGEANERAGGLVWISHGNCLDLFFFFCLYWK